MSIEIRMKWWITIELWREYVIVSEKERKRIEKNFLKVQDGFYKEFKEEQREFNNLKK